MTKTIKKSTAKPKTKPEKERVEEVMTPAGLFYRIYKGKKFVEMLTEQEFKERK